MIRHKGPDFKIIGVTFESVREAVTSLFFEYEGMTEEEFEKCEQYVVPMRHNWENPLEGSGEKNDTWIQYWIQDDDRLSSDYNDMEYNICHKVATIQLRFFGRRAEAWAKSFHHLTKRKSCDKIFSAICNAGMFGYVSPITPVNVDYFGTGNTELAFSVVFRLEYDERLDFSEGSSGGDRLMYISFPPGNTSNK